MPVIKMKAATGHRPEPLTIEFEHQSLESARTPEAQKARKEEAKILYSALFDSLGAGTLNELKDLFMEYQLNMR